MSTAPLSQERPVWPLGVGLCVGTLLLTPVLVVSAEMPMWVMPVVAIATLGWSFAQPDRTILGFSLQRLRALLIGLVVLTLLQAASISSTQRELQIDANAKEIAALGQSNPAAQAAALAKADTEMLSAIGKVDPSLRDEEIARRNEAKAVANAPRIAELLAQGRKLDKGDVDGRISIWRKLVSLAPGEADYRTSLTELEEKKARADRIRANPEEGVEVVVYRWHTSGFGAVMMLDITLRNDSSVELRDFVINCEHSGPSGTVIDRNSRTLYEKLAAGEKRKFRNVNMGLIHSQVEKTACQVDGAKVG